MRPRAAASSRQRREAELFFQALIGEPTPRPARTSPPPSAGAATPAAIFDALVFGSRMLPAELASRLEVVARPGEPLVGRLRGGDRLLRRGVGEGNLTHISVLVDGALLSEQAARDSGHLLETSDPGLYAGVHDGGWSQPATARFARRLGGPDGHLGGHQLVVRDRGGPTPDLDDREGVEHWGEALVFSAVRFQGNTRLDDALNGRRNIQAPLVDPAVTIIQQALVDLGYELPRHGVDGEFGSETTTAVRLFQREQKRRDPAFTVDGVVGPQTMGRLDAIFAVLDRPCSAPTLATADPSALVVAQPGTITYNGGTVTVNGVSVEVRGTIFYPAQAAGSNQPYDPTVAANGPAPIVFIAHGNHETFHDPAVRTNEDTTQHSGWLRIPSHDGYPYFQELLARLGIISVSVDCHESNGFGLDPTNIRLRSGMIVESIRHVMTLNAASSGSTLAGQVDFARTGLLGHSRGGEAVVAVPSDIAAAGAPVNGANVRGIVSLAPTECGTVTTMPTGMPYMVILPAGDGDVVTNDGAKLYDRFAPAPFKCQLYIHRTNHNRFNREWPNDDALSGAAPIPRTAHERILEVYGAAFFRQAFFAENMRPILSGAQVVAGVQNDEIFISHEINTFTTVDDHEVLPPVGTAPIAVNSLGGATRQAGTLTATEAALSLVSPPTSPNGNYPGATRGMVATSPTAYGTFRSALPAAVDLTNREVWIRAAESYDGASVPAGATRFQIGVEDHRGQIAFVSSGDLARPFDRRLDDLTNPFVLADHTKTVFQTIRIPQSCLTLARPGVDMTRIAALVIRMHGPAGRRMVFDTLQISSP
jgi:Putative peptidoglycan binding domain